MNIETVIHLEESDIINIIKEHFEKQGYEIINGLEIYPKTDIIKNMGILVKTIPPIIEE